ncbi:MAG: hypothetical protein ACTSVZ_08835 [Promethearchaeota archaeon]
MESVTTVHQENKLISHGICEDCRFKLEYNILGLEKFIITLEKPILVVDGKVRVQAGNSRAIKLLQKCNEDIKNQLAGDVIQCVYSDLPGGCGKTIHCSGCTIRNSAEKTYETGQSLTNIKAYQILKTPAGPKHKIIFISTEKVGDLVLLQFDDILDDIGSD